MRVDGVIEYTRDCKIEGALLARIVFLCVVYAFLGFITLMLCISTGIVGLVLFGTLSLAVVLITKPFFREQRDYEIVGGSFRIYKIYGGSLARKVFECELSSMELIVSYHDADIKEHSVKDTKDFLSDGRSIDALYAVYVNGGQRHAVIFDGDEKFYRAAGLYARRAIREYHS